MFQRQERTKKSIGGLFGRDSAIVTPRVVVDIAMDIKIPEFSWHLKTSAFPLYGNGNGQAFKGEYLLQEAIADLVVSNNHRNHQETRTDIMVLNNDIVSPNQ